MKKVLFVTSFMCMALIANAQGYRGSDADRMMYQRMQQQAQRNSGSNTYVPQRSYSSGSNSNYSGNGYGQTDSSYSGSANVERIIQGVYVYNNQLAVVRLRYYAGKIVNYSTSRDMMGREQWQSMYPDTPHPTMELQDGQLAREYKYKVSVSRITIYFNL